MSDTGSEEGSSESTEESEDRSSGNTGSTDVQVGWGYTLRNPD